MNIYIGNMSFNTTEDQLRDAFAAHGDVSTVTIVTDRETGARRGFAFVEMPNKDQASAAISALNGADLDGRTLSVNEARPKTEGGGRGGAGGGGNRGGGGGNYRKSRY